LPNALPVLNEPLNVYFTLPAGIAGWAGNESNRAIKPFFAITSAACFSARQGVPESRFHR
jgi:hypothetical protein